VFSEHRRAIRHRGALRESRKHQRPGHAERIHDKIDVCDVVRDRRFAILPRHPTGDDLLIASRVEAMQGLRRRHRPALDASDLPDLRELIVGGMPVPVKRDDESDGRRDRGVLNEDAAVSGRRDRQRSHSLYLIGAGTLSVTSYFFNVWLTAIALTSTALASAIALGSAAFTSAYCFISVSLGVSENASI
jgi:hypothetical protein